MTPDKDPTLLPILTYIWVIWLSAFGGVVNYIRKRREGIIPSFSITEFIGEVVTSSFAGMITFFMCSSADIDPMLSAALIAISGHMGSRAIFMLEKVLQKKWGD